MMIHRFALAACAALSLGSFGCSSTVRYMTATHWMTPADSAQTSATPAPAAPADPAAAAAAAAPGAAAKSQRILYITYWEGNCSKSFFGGSGCSKGNGHVKRCNVQPDNTLKCVDEKDVDKALTTD